MVEYLQAGYAISVRRACEVIGQIRSSHYYRSVADPQTALRLRLRDLANTRIGYGYRRLPILLQREGWKVNHKRVYRLYVQEGLVLRTKPPRRRKSVVPRSAHPKPTRRNQLWSMDFVSDELGWKQIMAINLRPSTMSSTTRFDKQNRPATQNVAGRSSKSMAGRTRRTSNF